MDRTSFLLRYAPAISLVARPVASAAFRGPFGGCCHRRRHRADLDRRRGVVCRLGPTAGSRVARGHAEIPTGTAGGRLSMARCGLAACASTARKLAVDCLRPPDSCATAFQKLEHLRKAPARLLSLLALA